MNRPLALAAASLLFFESAVAHADWTPAWSASPQPVWVSDFLFPTGVPATLKDRTVRQVARIGLGGGRVRLRLSNDYGRQPVRIDAAQIARSAGGTAITADSDRRLTFAGSAEAIIPPGGSILSDPIAMSVADGERLAVSLHFPDETPVETFHWDGRAQSPIVAGQRVSDRLLPTTTMTTLRLYLTGILVDAPEPRGTVVILGDSITDGAGATMDADTRWPDYLAARAAPKRIAIVNAGISGARLLGDRMGANAFARFDRDVLAQPKVRTMILMLGINDIAWPGTPLAADEAPMTFEQLTAGYRQLVERAHANGVRVVGATLIPFADALPGTPLAATYYSADKDRLRGRVNEWIRTSGTFDDVIDFDRLMRDPTRPNRLLARYDSVDHLHPGDAGNNAMADAIDLDTILGDQP